MLSGLTALGQLSLFLASLFMLWMILKVLLQFTQRKGNGSVPTNGASGQMPISYWRQEIKKAVREELEYWDKGRLEKFREMIREELRYK